MGEREGYDKVYLHVCNLRLLMNYDKVNVLYRYYKSVAALLVGRSRDQFPVVSLDFSVTYFLPTVQWSWGRLSP